MLDDVGLSKASIFSWAREAGSTTELEHHASGSLAADRATSGQILSEVPDKDRYPGPPALGNSGADVT